MGGYYQWQLFDQYVKRIDGNGALIWQLDFNGGLYSNYNQTINGVACADDLSMYVSGTFYDSIVVGQYTLTTAVPNRPDIFLAHVSPSGTVLWLKQIGSDFQHDNAGEVTAYPGGRVILVGTVTGPTVNFLGQTMQTDTMNQYFMARIDGAGNIQNLSIASPTGSYSTGSGGNCVCTDVAGNIYSILYPQSPILLGGTTFTNTYYDNLVKMDSSMNVIWTNTVSSSYYYYGPYTSRIRADRTGEVVALLHSSGHYYSSSFLRKFTSSGTAYATYLAGQLPNTFSVGSIYSWYTYFSNFDLDSCNNIYVGAGIGGNYYSGKEVHGSYLVRFSPALQPDWIWCDTISNPQGYWYYLGADVVATSPNQCFVSGNFSDTLYLHDTLYATNNNIGYYGKFSAVMSAPLNLTPAKSSTTCAMKGTTLSASGGGMVQWYTTPTSSISVGSGMSFTTPPLPAGTYTYYADATTCTITTGRAPIVFTVHPGPQLSVNSGTICGGQTFTFFLTGAQFYIFPALTPTVKPNFSTTYSIVGINQMGCASSVNSSVTLLPLPQMNIMGLNKVCPGYPQQLTASGALSYYWNTGATGNAITVAPISNTVFVVSGIGPNSCTNSISMSIVVEECAGIQESTINEPRLYPVPADDALNISTGTDAQIIISDVRGSVVFSGPVLAGTTAIPIRSLEAGCYFVTLKYANKSNFRKIVVSR